MGPKKRLRFPWGPRPCKRPFLSGRLVPGPCVSPEPWPCPPLPRPGAITATPTSCRARPLARPRQPCGRTPAPLRFGKTHTVCCPGSLPACCQQSSTAAAGPRPASPKAQTALHTWVHGEGVQVHEWRAVQAAVAAPVAGAVYAWSSCAPSMCAWVGHVCMYACMHVCMCAKTTRGRHVSFRGLAGRGGSNKGQGASPPRMRDDASWGGASGG